MRLLSLLLLCLALVTSYAIAVDGQTSIGNGVHVGEGTNVEGFSLQDLERRITALETAVRSISPSSLPDAKGLAR